jgi:Tfp pilus assembly protein PilP
MRLRLTIAFVVGLAAPVAAQTPAVATAGAPASPAATSAASTAAPAVVTPAPAKADEPSGYTYHAEGRRDPFVSLLRRAAAETPRGSAGARLPGLAGLGAGEVSLKGTMQGREGYIAMLLGADNKTYIVRPGDRLLDGAIRTITADSLVILQQVNDPLSPQKQREVRKMLRQTEEAK